jgi:hypothetical protein
LGAAYCVASRRGGAFAQSGTISSSLLLPEQPASSALKIHTTRMRSMTAISPRMPLYPCSSASGRMKSSTQARHLMLSPIHVSKDEQRQPPLRALMLFQVRRERLAHSIECSAHYFQGFGIVHILDVAG